ncbi:MAG: LPS export ABC transporter permease LptF [Pseudomonadota bacterium]
MNRRYRAMLRILDRYVLKEMWQTWVTVTAVLLMILLSNQVADVLGDAARDKVAKDAVFSVIGLTALQYLTIIIPFGLFLAVMLSLARLYSDSELPAMLACRIGPGGLFRPLAWLAIPLAGLVAWLALFVSPESLRRIELIGAQTQRQVDLSSLEAGRFVEVGGDEVVIFANAVGEDGTLENVFLQRRDAERLEIVLAEYGRQQLGDDPDTRFIVLTGGRRYVGVPGQTTFQVIEFREYGVPYVLPAARLPELDPEAQSLQALLDSPSPESAAELQWRLSIPVATLTLALLAVPLSRSQPRQGRYGKIAIGILVFIIYFNLIGAAKVWVERGELSPSIGLWGVHIGFVCVALLLYGAQNGWFARMLPAPKAV